MSETFPPQDLGEHEPVVVGIKVRDGGYNIVSLSTNQQFYSVLSGVARGIFTIDTVMPSTLFHQIAYEKGRKSNLGSQK